MRTWGRIPNAVATPGVPIGQFVIGQSAIGPGPDAGGGWVEVTTDDAGYNDEVWLTTLAQVLMLNLGESPMFGNFGIPAQQSVITNVLPDYYVSLTQQQFAQFFTSLIVSRLSAYPPTYAVNVVTNAGAVVPPGTSFPI
jgi:hypothetical protein